MATVHSGFAVWSGWAVPAVMGVVTAVSCGSTSTPASSGAIAVAQNTIETELERRQRLFFELQDDILSSYERDDLPDVDTALIDAKVGPARIGVGPGDVLFGDDVKLRASSRWPLFVAPGTQVVVRSKRLDIRLASDRLVSAAWMSDEVSWRVKLCGRTAAIPLRITALYARDGNRWVPVVEHLSFGSVPTPSKELYGLPMKQAEVDKELAAELERTLAPVLSRDVGGLASVLWFARKDMTKRDLLQPAPTRLIAPDPEGEWHGAEDVGRAQIVDGVLEPETRRVGTIASHGGGSTVAYWVGNFIAHLDGRRGVAGGTVRLRGSFVFEKRAAKHTTSTDCRDADNACKWYVVQGHVSRPVDDMSLASAVFGTALLSDKPLQIMCNEATGRGRQTR